MPLTRCLIWLAFAFVAFRAHAGFEVVELNAKNIEEQPYKFSIKTTKDLDSIIFEIRIEPKTKGAIWNGVFYATVILKSGDRLIARCPIAVKASEKAVEVARFEVSSEYLTGAKFDFTSLAYSTDISPMPSGGTYWFYLRDFTDAQ